MGLKFRLIVRLDKVFSLGIAVGEFLSSPDQTNRLPLSMSRVSEFCVVVNKLSLDMKKVLK